MTGLLALKLFVTCVFGLVVFGSVVCNAKEGGFWFWFCGIPMLACFFGAIASVGCGVWSMWL